MYACVCVYVRVCVSVCVCTGVCVSFTACWCPEKESESAEPDETLREAIQMFASMTTQSPTIVSPCRRFTHLRQVHTLTGQSHTEV